jgi:hypothetical protein
MPKNTVIDPIDDKEMAFAHLLMSGTMTDREAAQAAGLNPETASYTKAKPRIRDYMVEHRAAVEKKLVEQEAEGLRRLNLSRDQILTRLWELANLSAEATRGSIAGQIKALSMIVAIEGLIQKPDLAHRNQYQAAPRAYLAESRLEQQQQAEHEEPAAEVAPEAAQPDSPIAAEPKTSPKPAASLAIDPPPQNQPSQLNPFINPEKRNWVPDASVNYFDVALDTTSSLSLPLSLKKRRFGGHR